eukprot:jgi/Tetstr1/457784/TSEL_044329.t1
MQPQAVSAQCEARRPPPEPEVVLRGHLADVQAVAFHTDPEGRRRLFSGDADGEVKAWELETMRTCSCIRAAGVGITSLTPSRDGAKLLSQTRDGGVTVLECQPDGQLTSGSPADAIHTGAYNFCRVAVLWGGHAALGGGAPLLATAGADPAVAEVWDLAAHERLLELGQPGNPYGMCMALALFAAPGGSLLLLVGYEDGTVALWDCGDPGQPLAVLPRLHAEPVMSVAVDALGEGAVTCAADKLVARLSMHAEAPGSGKLQLQVARSAELPTPGAASVAIRPDRRIFAIGAWSGDTWVYSYKKCAPLARLAYHSAGVTHVAFSNQGDGVLASASRDSTIALWRLYPPP